MKRALVLLVVCAVAAVVASSGAFADEGQWKDTGLYSVTNGAFNVNCSIVTNADGSAWSVDYDGAAFYYYQWDVTLNNGPYHLYDDYGNDQGLLTGYLGLAVMPPLAAPTLFDTHGALAGGPADWEREFKKWYPDETSTSTTYASWWGSRPLGVGDTGIFRVGIWSDNLIRPGTTWANQIHARAGESNSGFVHFTTEMGTTTDEPVDPFPVTTPELSTWALLGCTALFGVGYMKKRRT